MPERKKQHYVPKLYMRNFTDTGRVLCYNLERRQEFPPTSIGNLCYEDYFYSEDTEVEEATSQLEGKFASVLREILESESLSVLGDPEEDIFFYIFLTHTHARTKMAKKQSEEFATHMAQLLVQVADEDDTEEDLEKRQNAAEMLRERKLRVRDSPVFPMQELASMYAPFHIGDLEAVLLKDASDRQFIFSDHPIIVDNPGYKNRFEYGTTGWQCRGLQVFCPISSELAIMLYDPVAYDVPDRPLIQVGSDVVEDLNKFQLINAYDSVFYEEQGREAEMQILHDEVEEFFLEEHSVVRHFDEDDPRFDTDNEVVGFSTETPDFSPSLPFTSFTGAEFVMTRSPERNKYARDLMDKALEEGRKDTTG